MRTTCVTVSLMLGVMMAATQNAEARILEIHCGRHSPMAAAGGQGAKESTPYTSIAAALANARDGDTLLVNGTCRENVLITRDRLTLRGTLGATIEGRASEADATDASSVVEVRDAADVRLRNLTVVSATGPAVAATQRATVDIGNLTVRIDSGDGITVEEGSQTRVVETYVERTNPDATLAAAIARPARTPDPAPRSSDPY